MTSSGMGLAGGLSMKAATTRPRQMSTGRDCFTPFILDDDQEMVEMLQKMVESMGYAVFGTTHAEEVLEHVRLGDCRVAICDLRMPGMDGMAFLDQALKIDPGGQVILATGHNSLDSAIEAGKHGAYDYIPKPVERVRLKRTLDELAEVFTQRKRVRQLEEQLLTDLEFHGIVGKSPAMLEGFDQARKGARQYTHGLPSGPTGVGKEPVPPPIHQLSPAS